MDYSKEPRLVAWESTRACNLACVHCRAEAQLTGHPDQLKTGEVLALIDEIAEFARPIFIITGGEPMMREDVYDIASYATSKGFRPVMSPNGTLITPESIIKMKKAGISRISVSLDGSTPGRNNAFRMVEGAFEQATRGLAYAREAGMPFQINTTVTQRNVDDLPDMLKTVIDLGAVTWDVFMLVPTGRGKIEDEVSPEQYEEVLNWIWEVSQTSPIHIKVTCGPHYMRVARQRLSAERKQARQVAAAGGTRPGAPAPAENESVTHAGGPPPLGHSVDGDGRSAGHLARAAGGHPRLKSGGFSHPGGGHGSPFGTSRGCMAGNGFVFISHTGDVFPCGYFPVKAGNVREQNFREIYQNSELFVTIRDPDKLGGKCGVCEFKAVCFGCRARALSAFGDYMAEEPYCIYVPLGAVAG